MTNTKQINKWAIRIGIIITLFAGALLAQQAEATTLYVRATGDDDAGANNCQTEGSPCLTVAQAVSEITGDDDTINIGEGTFTATNIAPVNSVIFQGVSSSLTRLSGGGAERLFSLTTSGKGYTFNNLRFQEGAVAGNGGAIYANDVSVFIAGCAFGDNSISGAESSGGAIYFDGADAGGRLLTISGTTFAENAVPVNGSGGAIYATAGADLNITSSTIGGNSADGGSGMGGGIYAAGSSVVIGTTTFSNNISGTGAALYVDAPTSFSVSTSTFTGNSAGVTGSAIYVFNSETVTATVVNSTFSENIGDAIAGGSIEMMLKNITVTSTMGGAAVSAEAATGVSVNNSIIADSSEGTNECSTEGSGAITGTYSIDSGTSCGFGSTNGNKSSTDPGLVARAANGGSTNSHAITTASPAFNAGENLSCLMTDQRGVGRPSGETCDIGAFELVTLGTPATFAQFLGSQIPSITVENGATPDGAVITLLFAGCEEVDEISGTLSGTTLSVNSGTAIPACATTGTNALAMSASFATNVNLSTTVSAIPVIGGATSLTGRPGDAFPAFTISGHNIPNATVATIIPAGCTATDKITGAIASNTFTPNAGSTIPSCATLGQANATLTTADIAATAGLSAAQTASAQVPTNFTAAAIAPTPTPTSTPAATSTPATTSTLATTGAPNGLWTVMIIILSSLLIAAGLQIGRKKEKTQTVDVK